MNTLISTPNQFSTQVSSVEIQQSKNQQSKVQQLSKQQSEDISLLDSKPFILLQGVIEDMVDGILILTDQGKVVYANGCARRLCRQLVQDLSNLDLVPQQLWNVCEALIESRSLFPEQPIILEDEISTSKFNAVRVRARWIELDSHPRPCMLVALEDRYQSTKNVAIAEARKYGLTSREAEVWLLRKAEFAYKEIAAQLNIAVDTVKKHIKSINAKREAFQWDEE